MQQQGHGRIAAMAVDDDSDLPDHSTAALQAEVRQLRRLVAVLAHELGGAIGGAEVTSRLMQKSVAHGEQDPHRMSVLSERLSDNLRQASLLISVTQHIFRTRWHRYEPDEAVNLPDLLHSAAKRFRLKHGTVVWSHPAPVEHTDVPFPASLEWFVTEILQLLLSRSRKII
jgi:hypothetical protein